MPQRFFSVEIDADRPDKKLSMSLYIALEAYELFTLVRLFKDYKDCIVWIRRDSGAFRHQ